MLIFLFSSAVELPNGLEIWWDGLSRSVFHSKVNISTCFLLLLLIFTFLFNYNAYYTRVYIDAPPTFFGTTKAIRFSFFFFSF
jgi:hypothetical protein